VAGIIAMNSDVKGWWRAVKEIYSQWTNISKEPTRIEIRKVLYKIMRRA
jgi:hypothetical protein